MLVNPPERLNLVVPSEVYRGAGITSDDLTPEFFERPLVPGSGMINEDGERVVTDGNEWGVYMTDNPRMVEYVYGKRQFGAPVPDAPMYNRRGGLETLSYPPINVIYAISTHGLANLRRPRLNPTMLGHYNNGFVGDEWIADEVPGASYRVQRVALGAEALHAFTAWSVDGNLEEVVAAVRDEYAARAAKTDTLAERLREIHAETPTKLRNEFAMVRVLESVRKAA